MPFKNLQTQEAIDQANADFRLRIETLTSRVLMDARGTNILSDSQLTGIGNEVRAIANDFPDFVLDTELSGAKVVLNKVRSSLRDRSPERAKALKKFLTHKRLKAARDKQRDAAHPE